MTECERIVKDKVVNQDYLKEEIRYDYKVTTDCKKLWAVSLDLMLEFDRVCKKHNLKYFLIYGTLLGSIRHKGFIPWDDDVDICMLREDFDKLYDLVDEFKAPYFLQTPYSDKTCFFTTIRLRNSNTSYIDGPFKYQGFNQGISLSVAPLDFVPEDKEKVYGDIYKLIMDNAVYMRLKNPNLNERDRERVKNYTGSDPLWTYNKIQEIARETKEGKYVWSAVSQHYGLEHSIFEYKDFEQVEMKEFEGYSFPVPCGYDNVLKTIYGDYMTFPPVEKRGEWHCNAQFSPDIPYKEYLKQEGIL